MSIEFTSSSTYTRVYYISKRVSTLVEYNNDKKQLRSWSKGIHTCCWFIVPRIFFILKPPPLPSRKASYLPSHALPSCACSFPRHGTAVQVASLTSVFLLWSNHLPSERLIKALCSEVFEAQSLLECRHDDGNFAFATVRSQTKPRFRGSHDFGGRSGSLWSWDKGSFLMMY